MEDFLDIFCPYCNFHIIVQQNEVACKIFRCGILESNKTQVPPHASEQECQKFVKDGVIGCCKPFMLVLIDGLLVPVKCKYI
jgi:hypothetical protein